MHNITRKIALTELRMLFFSPVAWMILIFFTFQAAMYLTSSYGSWFDFQSMNYNRDDYTMNIFSNSFNGLFARMQQYLFLYIPLLTMGLMSRDLASGSIKLLYSSPIKNVQIILGKYLALMVYGLVLIGVVFVFVIWGSFNVKDFDWGLVLTGILGLYLLICTYSAIGLFISSLTSYQVVAAIGTLAVLAGLTFISGVGQDIDFVRDITYWFGLNARTNQFLDGMICSEDLFYFVTIPVLFLTLSVLRMKAIRQKMGWKASFGQYIGVVLIAVLVGYATSRPKLMAFYDTTATKRNTLAEGSREIVGELKGGLTMTTFVNALGEYLASGLPSNRIHDERAFRQYVRFKPEIKMNYVYYYARPKGSSLEARFPGLTDEELVGRIADTYEIDSSLFMPLEAVKRRYPGVDFLPEENFRLVRLLERASGEQVVLRMFNDANPYPEEAEISAALKHLLNKKLPVVAFLQGHGERDFDRLGDRSYQQIAVATTFRYSLVNNGFEFETVTFDEDIPGRVTILVIADMKSALSEEEQQRLDAYVARGGNLLILGDARRQEVMNPLLERFGVQLMHGQLVEAKREASLPTTIMARTTSEAPELSYRLADVKDHNFGHMIKFGVTMPGAVGLSYRTDGDFRVMPVLVSADTNSWNEVETLDFVDEVPVIHATVGEEERAYPVAVALSRQIAGREQRIVIAGDADWMSNGEMSRQRSYMISQEPISSYNFNFARGVFQWLSNNEVPIDTRRAPITDDRLTATEKGIRVSKVMLLWGFPGLLLLGCLLVWIRRRGR